MELALEINRRFRERDTVLIVDHVFGTISRLCDRIALFDSVGLQPFWLPSSLEFDWAMLGSPQSRVPVFTRRGCI
jgi:hypothetical protein